MSLLGTGTTYGEAARCWQSAEQGLQPLLSFLLFWHSTLFAHLPLTLRFHQSSKSQQGLACMEFRTESFSGAHPEGELLKTRLSQKPKQIKHNREI